MGCIHARAYEAHPDFVVAGIVNRGEARRHALARELGGVPAFADFKEALRSTSPDAVCIATYPDTHVSYALLALKHGAHVFVEKPMAQTAEDAAVVVEAAKRAGRALMIGYVLRVDPGWQRFVTQAQNLGKPLVLRFSLNQQSAGEALRTHLALLASASSLVDSGVHYVDVMCQMTQARPVRVQALGTRLRPETPADQFDYGQLQVVFEDGSVGWFEAGWGPSFSREAEFVRDVVGPLGSVTMNDRPHRGGPQLIRHRSELGDDGEFLYDDENTPLDAALDFPDLCARQQEIFLQAVRGTLDLSAHQRAAVDCLRVVEAADRSMRTGAVVSLHH
jgi:predicted dehydrogenase